MKEEKKIKKTAEMLGKYRETAEIRELFGAVFYCACAYLLGCAEMMFGTYPLGIAFMCTVKRHVPFAVIGALVSVFATEASLSASLCGWAAALLFRYALNYVFSNGRIVSLTALDDPVFSRICSAAAGMLSTSCVRIVAGGFTYYDLFSGVFSVSFAVFMVYVYSLVYDKENRYTQKYEAGICAVFFSFVFALNEFEFFGMSCGIAAAFILSVYTARRGGALRGTVTGFLCGAAVDLTLCPVFGAAGFLGGLLSGARATIGTAVSVGTALLCAAYTHDIVTATELLPEALLCLALYIPFERLKVLAPLRLFKDELPSVKTVSPDDIASERKNAMYKNGLDSLSKALEDISGVMCALSEKEKRPAVHEICELCEKEFSEFCKKCSMKKLCFPDGVRGSAHIRKTAGSIYEKGALSTSDLPEKIKTNCYFADKITVSLNIKLAQYNSEKLKNNKTEVMAEDYRSLSVLIGQTVAQNENSNTLNKELTEKLRRHSVCRELFSGNAAVYGTESLTVIACGLDTVRIKRMSEEMRNNFSKILGVCLTAPQYMPCGENTAAVFTGAQRFDAQASELQCVKTGEMINGDSVFSFTANGKFHACICDGMGSGRMAALTSKMACIFLQKLLFCGCNTEGALKMLNHFIKSKTGECFTTVDLLSIDLMTGKASFTKSGAAPSYIVRDGRIFKIDSHTPPVGIMTELCAERTDFVFKNGDIAVMASDGIAESDDPHVWLYNILTYESDTGTDELCETIMERSQSEHLGADDVTVCAIKITRRDI